MPLMKNVIIPLAKNVLLPLGVTTAASATDLSIQKKIYKSGVTALTVSKEEIKDVRIVKALKESGSLLKGISETIEDEAKEQKSGFLGMLLGTLGATFSRLC